MAEAAYSRPTSVEEALALVREASSNCLFVAGGTDILTYCKQELELRRHLIDLSNIESLKRVRAENGNLVIGAMTTLDELARSREAESWCSIIIAAARVVASATIRYTATVGGNLMVGNRCTYHNQSKLWRESAGSCLRESGPTCLATGGNDKCYARNVSDLAPALIALDGQIDTLAGEGSRVMPLNDLYRTDGLRAQGGLGSGSIIVAVRISLRPVRWYYRKLRQRESIDFASLVVAGVLTEQGEMRICLNGVSPAPVLLECNPSSLSLADLQSQARRACKTVDNDPMPLKYRRAMMDVYLEDLWNSLASRVTCK